MYVVPVIDAEVILEMENVTLFRQQKIADLDLTFQSLTPQNFRFEALLRIAKLSLNL